MKTKKIYSITIPLLIAFTMLGTSIQNAGDRIHAAEYIKKAIKPAGTEITILAFGDMMLSRDVASRMNQFGQDYIFEKLDLANWPFFKRADFVFANFEGPINGKGTSGGTAMRFSFNENVATFLKENGFNIFSITNNHADDQGTEGRKNTIKALDKADIGWCGHYSKADEDSVYYKEIDKQKVAFICFQDVSVSLNDEDAIELIEKVRPTVDYLIVSIHWGVEYKHKPHSTLQVNPGHDFIDAGADIIIGHHPHVVQSLEVYNDKFIFYSLGNFVFDQYWSTMTQQELGIGITLNRKTGKTTIELFPMKSKLAQSELMNKDEVTKWIEEFITYGDYDDTMKEQIRSLDIQI